MPIQIDEDDLPGYVESSVWERYLSTCVKKPQTEAQKEAKRAYKQRNKERVKEMNRRYYLARKKKLLGQP